MLEGTQLQGDQGKGTRGLLLSAEPCEDPRRGEGLQPSQSQRIVCLVAAASSYLCVAKRRETQLPVGSSSRGRAHGSSTHSAACHPRRRFFNVLRGEGATEEGKSGEPSAMTSLRDVHRQNRGDSTKVRRCLRTMRVAGRCPRSHRDGHVLWYSRPHPQNVRPGVDRDSG